MILTMESPVVNIDPIRCSERRCSDPEYSSGDVKLRDQAADRAGILAENWSHGAFTRVLLDAFGGGADESHSGLVSMSDLTRYISTRVPALTDGKQHPGVEQRLKELFSLRASNPRICGQRPLPETQWQFSLGRSRIRLRLMVQVCPRWCFRSDCPRRGLMGLSRTRDASCLAPPAGIRTCTLMHTAPTSGV
jgi:hypothetical protein